MTFKSCVTLCLDRAHRYVPAVLPGLDGFVIPVCALHQPDRYLRAVVFRPFQQFGQILVRIFQIRLQDNADMRILPVLQLQTTIQLKSKILVSVGLHVNAEKPLQLHNPGADTTHLLQHRLDRSLEILRVGQAKKRGRFDGYIYCWRMSPVQIRISSVPRQPLPPLLLFLQAIQNFKVGTYVHFRFFVCQGRLSQHVYNRGESLLAQLLDVFDCFFCILADYELPGHLLDIE